MAVVLLVALVGTLVCPGRATAAGAAPAAGSAGDCPPGSPAQRTLAARAPGDREPVRYAPPVDAPVVDPFRAPERPWGPGNRGLEYGTAPGDPVVASAPGTVLFAGPVAGALHVTIGHADGVRTSYSFLAEIDVVIGQRVAAGDPLGRAGGPIHLGARIGDVYIDPAALFVGAGTAVELLPLEVPPGSSPADEARALADLARRERWSLPSLGDAAGWVRDRLGGRLDAVRAIDPVGRAGSVVGQLGRHLLGGEDCTAGPAPERPAAAGGRRVAVTVGGLGSSSDPDTIDELQTDVLGYAPGDVVRFSYRGGRVPAPTEEASTALPITRYAAADTGEDPLVVARRLADLVEELATEDPEATIDIYGHSLGGVVTRLALLELEQRGVDLDRIGLVATLGSPHRGADLATAVRAVHDTTVGGWALEEAADHLDAPVGPDALAVRALSERSTLVRALDEAGVPDEVHLVSVAARGDLIVPSPGTRVDGAVNVVVPVVGLSAHSELVSSPEATRELGLALAGLPPGCEEWSDVLADVVVGEGISLAEDALGAGAALLLP